MITNLYTTYDRVALEHNPPFPSKNNATAVRTYLMSLPQNIDPADFQLTCIGSFNTETGELTSLKTPELIQTSASMNAKQDETM